MADTVMTASGPEQQGRSDPVHMGSCDVCRKKKSKCDMKRPSCASCDRHHRVCSYPSSRKKPGPRQGSRQASTVAVQRRLELLEGLLQSNLNKGPSNDSLLSKSPTPPSIRQQALSETCDDPPSAKTQRAKVDASALPDDATPGFLPLTAALRWNEHLNPETTRSESTDDPAFSPQSTSTHVVLTQDTERQLLSHFFTDVKPPVSVICEEKFRREYEAGLVPAFLLDAIFSLSARFSSAPEIQELKAMGPDVVGSYFRCRAGAAMDHISGNTDMVSLAEVTAAYLLAYHDFTWVPSRKAAEYCSKVVRMAYMAGLHQIDNASFTVRAIDSTSELDLEEKRCLWWGIFMLDTFSSLTSFVPPNIEDLSIASCLPTTLINKASTNHVFSSRRAFLDDDLATFWNTILHQEKVGIRTQAILIYLCGVAREMTIVRRLCLENPRCNLSFRLDNLRQKWEMVILTVPPWFLDPTLHESEIIGDDHRKRLEMIIMLHTLGLLSNCPPLDLSLKWPTESHQGPKTLENRSRDCLFHSQKIADVYRAWSYEYSKRLDSLMLPMSWYAASVLILHSMNKDNNDLKDRLIVWESVDLIMNQMHRCSRYWNIGNILMHSLEDLRAKSWRKINTATIFRLLLTVSAPQMQTKTHTKEVPNVTDPPVVSSSIENHVENLMSWPMPEIWMPDADLSATFDWMNFVPETEHSAWQA